MLWALRPSWTCSSMNARCGSHAEGVWLTGAGGRGGGNLPDRPLRAGGHPGGICRVPPDRLAIHPGAPLDLPLSRPVREQRGDRNPQMRLQDVHSCLPRRCRGISVTSRRFRPPSRPRARSDRVHLEEFGVATSGGIWVAAGAKEPIQGATISVDDHPGLFARTNSDGQFSLAPTTRTTHIFWLAPYRSLPPGGTVVVS